jgi:SAM-dependent methyltransferase
MLPELFLYFTIALAAAVYWALWTQLLGSGWLPMPASAIRKGLEKAEVGKKDVVFDLGCGDGRILLEGCKRCKWAVGFEIDPLRYLISKIRARGKSNVAVRHGNFFKKPLQEADVIFAYLHPKANARLATKLKREVRAGTRVVSYWWPIRSLREAWKDEKARLFVYRV